MTAVMADSGLRLGSPAVNASSAEVAGFMATVGLASALATSGYSMPWLAGQPAHTYAVVSAPHSSTPAAAAAAATGSSGGVARCPAAPSFRGLFSQPASAGGGRAAGRSSHFGRRPQPLSAADQLHQRLRQALATGGGPQATLPSMRGSGVVDGTSVCGIESTLHVRILAARGLKNLDTGVFGDVSDPYAVVRVGNAEERTPTIDNDLNPQWTEENAFQFELADGEHELHIEVMNANFIRDDSLGKASALLWDFPLGSWHRCQLPLEDGQGEIEFEVRFERSLGGRPMQSRPTASLASRARVDQVGRPEAEESPRRPPPRKPCLFKLPADWDRGLEDAAARGHSPKSGGGTAAAVGGRLGRSRSPSSVSARSRGGRSFALPDDLFDDPESLDLGDPAVGPAAAAWGLSYAAGLSSDVAEPPWPGSVRALASLDESLRLSPRLRDPSSGCSSRPSGGGFGGASAASMFGAATFGSKIRAESQHEAEDAAVAKALEREGAARRTAEAELARTLKTLRELALHPAPPMPKVQMAEPASTVSKAAAFQSQAPLASTAPAAVSIATAPASSFWQGPLGCGAALGSTPSCPSSPPAAVAAPAQPSAAAPGVHSAGTAAPAAAAPAQKPGDHREQCAQIVSELLEVEVQVKLFKQDDSHKQFRLDAKKALNTRIGQVSATLKSIQECTLGLVSMLSPIMDGSEDAKKQFVEYIVAERFADEAEVGIMTQARSAWPKARVVTRIFARYPGIWRRFQGFIFKACPYVIPDFIGSQAGRQLIAPGQRPEEPHTRFPDRMVAYQRLWLAALVIQGDLGWVWQWLARALNEPEATPISAPLLYATLETAGADAQDRYGRQFVKLVDYIDQHYMPQLEALVARTKGEEADQLRASRSRLRLWLDSFRATGRAPRPAGRDVEVAQEAALNPDL
mmetsp:Transcript_27204/g.90464  ORF Transcript_27204/g.90464 Transcript_27204/m.90464 type:complete len:919 (+) Transcript_27204:75-2831(+)